MGGSIFANRALITIQPTAYSALICCPHSSPIRTRGATLSPRTMTLHFIPYISPRRVLQRLSWLSASHSSITSHPSTVRGSFARAITTVFSESASPSSRFSTLMHNRPESPNHALQRTAPRVTARAFCERSAIYIWASLVRSTVGHAPRHAPPSLSLRSFGDATRSLQ